MPVPFYTRGVEVLLRSARKIFWVLRCKAVATSETNERIRTTTEAIREFAEVLRWCPGAESNHRHHDFQARSFIDNTTTYRFEMCLTAHGHSMR